MLQRTRIWRQDGDHLQCLKESSLCNRHPNLCFWQSSMTNKIVCCSTLIFFFFASFDLDMTGIHRNNPDLSIRVPGCYVTAAPLDNNWEETVAHSGEESDRGKDERRAARKPLTIWHIPHMLSERFKHSEGGQTQTDAVNVKSGWSSRRTAVM